MYIGGPERAGACVYHVMLPLFAVGPVGSFGVLLGLQRVHLFLFSLLAFLWASQTAMRVIPDATYTR